MRGKKTIADFPDIAVEWHPTKNGVLAPGEVRAGSKKYWWKCSKGHEWPAIANNRTGSLKRGCPECARQRISNQGTNSLAHEFPHIAVEWHPTKNGDLTPDRVFGGSSKRHWWKCSKHPEHEWQAAPASRTRRGKTGCPTCAGKLASPRHNLESRFPEVAVEWHPTKNGGLTPDTVLPSSGKRFWWKCPKGPDHEWHATPNKRTGVDKSGCPFCGGRKVSVTNSLAAQFSEIATEWHPTKNGKLTPSDVVGSSASKSKKYWWKCPNGSDHEWQATAGSRTGNRRSGCPFCAGLRVSMTNSLATQLPEVAAQWHPTKNGSLTPRDVIALGNKKYWWKCPNGPDHEWQGSRSRSGGGKTGCPFCANQRVSVTNCLATLFPMIAEEWHPTKNGNRTPAGVLAGNSKAYWWKCSKGHEWRAIVHNRTGRPKSGCPVCNMGWTVPALRAFVASLLPHLHSFTPAELYTLFQQGGLLELRRGRKSFISALATGRFPQEDLARFAEGAPSLVDTFIQDSSQTLEAIEVNANPSATQADDDVSDEERDDLADESATDDAELPVVQTKDVLGSLTNALLTSADEEAVEFFLASARAKLWRHAFQDEAGAVAQAQGFSGDGYAERVCEDFLGEHRRATELPIPDKYSFRVDGIPTLPNLMQRLAASRVAHNRRVGNWSGTGAGKTLSAVLASRVVDAKLTVICCPNSVVEGWRDAISEIFPDSLVATKTFAPDWATIAGDETGLGRSVSADVHRYLVFNYEAFQQPDSADRVRSLVEREAIDFVVVDEIHFAKQREVESMSQRKQLITALISSAGERNPDLCVLGMSATPVINNLQEGRASSNW